MGGLCLMMSNDALVVMAQLDRQCQLLSELSRLFCRYLTTRGGCG